MVVFIKDITSPLGLSRSTVVKELEEVEIRTTRKSISLFALPVHRITLNLGVNGRVLDVPLHTSKKYRRYVDTISTHRYSILELETIPSNFRNS